MKKLIQEYGGKVVSFAAGSGAAILVRWFPLFATISCAAMLFLMEGVYEELYVSQYHKGLIDTVMRWKDVSLDLRANPMMSFGIHVVNAKLSPTYWLGYLVDSDISIPAEAAFQSVVMLLISAALVRTSGAGLSEAFAIGVVAMAYCWIPSFSGDAITANTIPGLWQEGTIAALLAFFFFSKIGLHGKAVRLLPPAGLALTILWFCLSLPYMVPFFALTTAFLCLGALCAADDRRELLQKAAFSMAIIGMLLLLGIYNYVLNIFAYTPQMFYRTLHHSFFAPLSFKNETLLLAAGNIGGAKIYLFFGLATIGALTALRYGNRFARRVVFAAIALEVMVHVMAALNIIFKVTPLTFLYVEQMGIPFVAVLAGTGVWAILRVISIGFDRALAAVMMKAERKPSRSG